MENWLIHGHLPKFHPSKPSVYVVQGILFRDMYKTFSGIGIVFVLFVVF